MSPNELPAAYQALLDADTYEELFRDLAELPGLEVSVKRGVRVLGEERGRLTLPYARALLERGDVRAVQVRYGHEGALWTDVILRAGAGFRLVRMAVPV